MTRSDQHESAPTAGPRSWQAAAVTAIVPLFAVGWFLLTWQVMGDRPGDAVGEALGAGLGLMVALSVVGAIRHARRARRERLDQDAPGTNT